MGFPRKRGHGRQLRYRELVSHSVWLFRSSCLWGSEKGREGYNGPAKWSRERRSGVNVSFWRKVPLCNARKDPCWFFFGNCWKIELDGKGED